jgi:hypothetical protein
MVSTSVLTETIISLLNHISFLSLNVKLGGAGKKS